MVLKYLVVPLLIGGCYVWEYWVKETIAKKAKESAKKKGKPVLDYGCGYFPRGDVNCDIIPRDAPNFVLVSPDTEKLPFEDKEFGAALCFHVLEHLDNPDHLLKELNRVADEVYVITPNPTFPQNLLHPEHRWIYLNGKRIKNPLYPHIKDFPSYFLKRLKHASERV